MFLTNNYLNAYHKTNTHQNFLFSAWVVVSHDPRDDDGDPRDEHDDPHDERDDVFAQLFFFSSFLTIWKQHPVILNHRLLLKPPLCKNYLCNFYMVSNKSEIQETFSSEVSPNR
jgi:hypothetical protein